MAYLLTILIPTYNRANDLRKNLESIITIINENSLTEEVSIIVSNNKSTDNTCEVIKSFLEYNFFKYYEQPRNVGLEKNALFTLAHAESKYVMYLGDDDYFSKDYLLAVISLVKCDNIHCIVPSWQAITRTGDIMNGISRDIELKNKLYTEHFKACLNLSSKGHQLSGLVFYREGLYESYVERGVSNIYPFIYFVAYSCLHGNAYHLTSFPLLITQPGQERKDWSYGDDGLIPDMLNNFKCLDLSYIRRVKLQIMCLKIHRHVLTYYSKKGVSGMFKLIKKILFNDNTLFIAKLFLLVYSIYLAFRSLRHIF